MLRYSVRSEPNVFPHSLQWLSIGHLIENGNFIEDFTVNMHNDSSKIIMADFNAN